MLVERHSRFCRSHGYGVRRGTARGHHRHTSRRAFQAPDRPTWQHFRGSSPVGCWSARADTTHSTTREMADEQGYRPFQPASYPSATATNSTARSAVPGPVGCGASRGDPVSPPIAACAAGRGDAEMTVSIPLIALVAVVAYVAYRHMGLRVWHAIVCALLRFPACRNQRRTANPELYRRDHPVAPVRRKGVMRDAKQTPVFRDRHSGGHEP